MASEALGKIFLSVALGGVQGVLRSAAWLQASLPNRVRVSIGRSLGTLFSWTGFRSKVIRQNLGLAFPGDLEKQDRIFRETYRHLGQLVLEILLLFGPMKKLVLRNVQVLGKENVEAGLKGGKGIILLTSHLGNWEILAAGMGLSLPRGVLIVTKQNKPAWLHQAIEAGRKKCDVSGAYEPRTLRDVLAQLKGNGGVGFVLDQYAGPPVGIRVPFFGVPVGTPSVVAAVAKRTGAAVVPVKNYRLPDGRWVVDFRPSLEWREGSDPRHELAINTAYYASIIEKDILAHPEQWLWTHRRFKGDLSPLKAAEWNEPRSRTGSSRSDEGGKSDLGVT